jgi:glycosyltransferase involved in cell wall biosynthesis
MSFCSPLLLIVETHPVQYRAPVYARLHELCPGSVHVVYASDYSVRGGRDPGFAQAITWDTDLLAGYPSTVLRSDLAVAPSGWNSLDGRGLQELIQSLRPSVILLSSLNYRFDAAAYAIALLKAIPVWIRCETQDDAFERSWLKSMLRLIYYRGLYSGITKAFPIGRLNRDHWLRHGLRPRQLHDMHYCTPDPVALLSSEERAKRRQALRQELGLPADQLLVAFFGKLIPKKDPTLLLHAPSYLPASLTQRLRLLYVGSGELQDSLQAEAIALQMHYGIRTHFAGFVNQTALIDWYLAADVVVLPSRRSGETWGLVANEALQAGCGVVVSEAVGCAADFGNWERFRTIPVGSAPHLALAITELATYQRSFDWAAEGMKSYSIEAAAQSLSAAIAELR